MASYFVANFYHFTSVPAPDDAKADLTSELNLKLGLSGLIIVAVEGLNGTIAAEDESQLKLAVTFLGDRFHIPPEQFKFSLSERPLFSGFKVKIRNEIVTLGVPELTPSEADDRTKLSPEEWNQWLKSNKKFHLIDARNHYEFKIGSFKGAIDPEIDQFTEFPEAVENHLKIPKDEPILTFCTGGIRCEKGVLELKRRGYKQVYQLHGGILTYLKDHPFDEFDGECFVFDYRVSVDQNLQPTKTYSFCPHCGDAAKELITCELCETQIRMCDQCLALEGSICSKNCSHHKSQGKTRIRRSMIRTHRARTS